MIIENRAHSMKNLTQQNNTKRERNSVMRQAFGAMCSVMLISNSLQELSTHWTLCIASLTKILNESCEAPSFRKTH